MKQLTLLLFIFLYSPSFAQTIGVTHNGPKSYDGYTLFSPMPDSTIYLIDNCGYVVNSWVTSYKPGLSTYLLEDGSILRPGQVDNAAFPLAGSGGQIQRYDWNGNLTWDYTFCDTNYCQHHDVEFLPNGNVLILARELKNQAECLAAGRNPAILQNNQLWPEFIVEIEPIGLDSGRIVWEWHVWDHLVQNFDNTKLNYQTSANAPQLINLNFLGGSGNNSGSDWIHANAIDYNPDLDQIILSSKPWSEFWIIDHSTTSVEAASHNGGTRGKGGDLLYRWGNPEAYGSSSPKMSFDQHDVHWIPPGSPDAGKIMIFNNGRTRDWSSVDIIIPPVDSAGNYILSGAAYGPTSLYWTYADPIPTDFYSRIISGAQQLPNGNTLICYGTKGYFFEIDSTKSIVWEYKSPVKNTGIMTQGQAWTGAGTSVFRAYRFGADFIGFSGKSLIPTAPIELNPNTSNCNLYSNLNFPNPEVFISVYPNPTTNLLTIECSKNGLGEMLVVYNLLGQMVFQQKINDNISELQLGHLARGAYVLKIGQRYTQKVILN